MDETAAAVAWTEIPTQFSADPDPSIHSTSFGTSSHSSFVDSSSFTTTGSTPSFVHSSETFSHPASASSSFDSLQAADISGPHIYDAVGSANTDLSTSILSDTMGTSSIESMSMVDMHSRKTSLSSMHENAFPSNLVRSPEFEDQSGTVTTTGWRPTASSIIGSAPSYAFRHPSEAVGGPQSVSDPAAFYTTSQISAGPSQSLVPFGHHATSSVQMMAPSSMSNLPISGMATHVDSFHTRGPVTPMGLTSTATEFPTQSLVSSGSDGQMFVGQLTKSSGGGHSRSSTGGSTRRAKFKRSRTGCMVCRKRKVKCEQDGLPCKQCRIGKRECHYEENPAKRKRKSKNENEMEQRRRRRTSGSSEVESMRTMPESEASLTNEDADSPIKSTLSTSDNLDYSKGTLALTPKHEEVLFESQEQQVREAAEELKRTTDALFAQHTTLQAGDDINEEDREEIPDQIDAFSLQYTNDDDDSIESIEPWSTRGNDLTNEDWTTSTVSSGPSSSRTLEGESINHPFKIMTSEDTPESMTMEGIDRIDSPYEKYSGQQGEEEEEKLVTVAAGIEDLPWYQNQNVLKADSTLSEGMGL